MENADIVFGGNRRLLIVSSGSWTAGPEVTFACLLPAWTSDRMLGAKAAEEDEDAAAAETDSGSGAELE
jgi:hypothetical protein